MYDGSVIPPVLITTDPQVPDDVEGDQDAIVLYMPGVVKPSAKTTLAYLDAVREYFNHGDHVLLDRGTEFRNKKVEEEFRNMRVLTHFFPTGGGAFFNPNDNSYFSQVEGYYNRSIKRNYADALRAIIGAYMKPTDEHVRNYFKHCLIERQLPNKRKVQSHISQHWIHEAGRAAKYRAYVREYERFISNSRLLSEDVRRIEDPLFLEGDTYDGLHWTKYNQ